VGVVPEMTNSYKMLVFKPEEKAELDMTRAGHGWPKLSVVRAEANLKCGMYKFTYNDACIICNNTKRAQMQSTA
jgi:hypothetical protein